jgi:hypothetical protein
LPVPVGRFQFHHYVILSPVEHGVAAGTSLRTHAVSVAAGVQAEERYLEVLAWSLSWPTTRIGS